MKHLDARVHRALLIFAVSNSCIDPVVYGQYWFRLNFTFIKSKYAHFFCLLHVLFWCLTEFNSITFLLLKKNYAYPNSELILIMPSAVPLLSKLQHMNKDKLASVFFCLYICAGMFTATFRQEATHWKSCVRKRLYKLIFGQSIVSRNETNWSAHFDLQPIDLHIDL